MPRWHTQKLQFLVATLSLSAFAPRWHNLVLVAGWEEARQQDTAQAWNLNP